jgi:hypothetical protein
MTKILLILTSLFFTFSFAHAENNNASISVNDDLRELYIDLIKRILANTIYEDDDFNAPYDSSKRESGLDHPINAHTMIGIKRLNNIHHCLKQIIENNIPGDCIETGVWRGGATILMRAILKAYNDNTRKVWVADSFEGLPLTNPDKYPADRGYDCLHHIPYLAVSLDNVRNNFKKYELLDDQVVFLKGLFKDSLPTAPISQLSLLRLDGDLYESTMDALINLYPKLSSGGFLIIDDYTIWPCQQAVHDYRHRMNINEPMIWIDSASIFWRKEG